MRRITKIAAGAAAAVATGGAVLLTGSAAGAADLTAVNLCNDLSDPSILIDGRADVENARHTLVLGPGACTGAMQLPAGMRLIVHFQQGGIGFDAPVDISGKSTDIRIQSDNGGFGGLRFVVFVNQ